MSVVETASPLPASAALNEHDATFRRVVWRIVPCVTLIWFLAWIDRVNVGFAKLTMMNDLQWSDAVYGAGAGIFFIGYFLFEVPSNMLLQKIGARKTIMRITIGWGVICVAMAWVQTPGQFYLLRFLMGAFEAGLQPGVILYLTYWLPTHRRGKALGLFVSASAISLVVGSPLAAYIMEMSQGTFGMQGWQWLFIVEGIPSVIIGIVAFFILTDLPSKAKWLSAREKEHIAAELADEDRKLGPREHSFFASLRDGKIWVLIAVFFCIIAGNATLVYYGPSLVKEVGFTDIKTLGWIMGGIYACGWGGMVLNGWLSDRRQEARLHTAAAAAIGAAGLLLAAYFVGEKNAAGLILSLALSSAGTMGAIPIFWQLPGQYLSGSAIAIGLAVINSVANLSGYFSPQLLGYLKTTTGRYTQGLAGIALVELLATLLIVVFIGSRRADSA
ncbi:MFS transporter [Herbaspirillum sp. SJZ099]|uniref:MFS transporter n=1 Tax=Herbaspirillum sp. SJZ099 TaxID=2572916 RepID=UPI0011A6A757|nr:MFS transporter [Herbaspirillum sp. SJZ099]TWC69531.1 sugar phosphate permease [Herbaspirillum sp. SJZ099]